MEPTSPAGRTLWPTLTTCYRPIEIYRELLAEVSGNTPPPALALSALDAFLLRQVAEALPHPTIIDLAADALNGASVAGWLASQTAHQLYAPSCLEPPATDWRQQLPVIAERLEWPLEKADFTRKVPAPNELTPAAWEALSPSHNSLSPVLVVLAAPNLEPPALTQTLDSLFHWQPQATVVLLGLQQTGVTPALQTTLDFCVSHAAYRLTLLRELSPFFFASTIGVVHPAQHAGLQLCFDRLRQAFEGNFQFLAMAKALTEATLDQPTISQPLLAYEPSIEPPTLTDLGRETKRWLWQRVLPDWLKQALNRARRRAET